MSDGMQLFIIFIFVLALFSIINFLAISLSGHSIDYSTRHKSDFTLDSCFFNSF
ncbi:Protein of unknown function [Bacillus wiedmannii]|nr:Protein of unknown function [Bacillus wiedmannii]